MQSKYKRASLVLLCLLVLNSKVSVTVVFGYTESSVQRSNSLDEPLQATVLKKDFVAAKPVWPQGRETEMNLFVGFRAVFSNPDASEKQVGRVLDAGRNGSADIILRITGSSIYRIFLNGEFVGHGPARGPHGYWRVDNWPLTGLCPGKNIIAIEVAGYNADSYYLLDQPSFIQAEIVCGDKVLAATGNEKTVGENPAAKNKSFEAFILKDRVQKVERYSFQRAFVEYYTLEPGYDKWRSDCSVVVDTVRCAEFSKPKLLARRVPYPKFRKITPVKNTTLGAIEKFKPAKIWKGRGLRQVPKDIKGYRQQEHTIVPSRELQTIRNAKTSSIDKKYHSKISVELQQNSFALFDLGVNLTGFIGATIKGDEDTKLYITFDEVLMDNDVDFKRMGSVSAVGYELEPGEYQLESFEPYTMKFVKIIVLHGSCSVSDIYLREFANPQACRASFECSDERLNRLFEAARQTFRQNAVDIFMDCPSRERAGWLCDSFFTARVAFDLCGNTTVEKNFLENFSLPKQFKNLPEGMLPMCYPSDHYNGVFIPNWAMWFVLELEEYLARSGDRQLVDKLEPKVVSLLKYFEKFRNSDGLLEKLESWVFVEWSKANEFLQDISYATNMLYAETLVSAGRLYDKPDLIYEARGIRRVIRKQSYNGEFFVDNADRNQDLLEVTNNRTEVCQYYAFFFNVADPDSHKQLWDKLLNEFGPKRKRTNTYPQIHPANAFIGFYLRLELLSRYGHCKQLKDEMVDYFLYMADRTGTLWEHADSDREGSCNHGFASHIAHCLYRDILGIYKLDTQKKIVELRFSDVGLSHCRGSIPTPDGLVSLNWQIDSGSIKYQINAPDGYVIKTHNISGLELCRK